LFYQFIKRVVRPTVLIIEDLPLINCLQNFSNIILARLTPYLNEVIGNYQYGFRHYKSTTDQIFYIQQILEKKWEYNGTVHELFIGFNKAYDSVKREVLCSIRFEFSVPKKLVRLIKCV
jgi:hypothetical protein